MLKLLCKRCTYLLVYSSVFLRLCGAACEADLRTEALLAAKQAVRFLTDELSTDGGYLWRYSQDLRLREGEGVVTTRTIWVQPPGTPAVGEGFVQLYDATGDQQFLDAARAAAEALRRGQMRSGGWQAMVEFEPDRRRKWAYRTEPVRRNAKDQSSLDDDKTQSAIRFLVQLDRALKFEDQAVHKTSMFALDGLLQKGQLPNGGFPQVWTSGRENSEPPIRPDTGASYPDDWSRAYPGHGDYWYRYTLNDNLARDVIRTLFLAADIYQDERYHLAALRLADFLLLAQMPEPQPAWAQQYSFNMQPIWARKFEPPAITGSESQGVVETLLLVYERTGDRKYLAPIPRALDYLTKSALPDGRLARFYELGTNRPLYFDKTYALTYSDADVPTHYAFKVTNRVGKLRNRYEALAKQVDSETRLATETQPRQRIADGQIREIIANLDHRGAWVSGDGLRYHDQPGNVIDMKLVVRNLGLLAGYLRGSHQRDATLDDVHGKDTIERKTSRGEKLFNQYCAACHRSEGQGMQGRVPPLDGSPWVAGSEGRLIRIVLNGLKGPIEIHGNTYNLEMPSFRSLFRDEDIAAILTHVRETYGMPSPAVDATTVSQVRKTTHDRARYWTVKELMQVP